MLIAFLKIRFAMHAFSVTQSLIGILLISQSCRSQSDLFQASNKLLTSLPQLVKILARQLLPAKLDCLDIVNDIISMYANAKALL